MKLIKEFLVDCFGNTAKQHFINVMNANSKELRGKIEERNHQGKY
jgi:hypothetical protein